MYDLILGALERYTYIPGILQRSDVVNLP